MFFSVLTTQSVSGGLDQDKEMQAAKGKSHRYKRGLWTVEEDNILIRYVEVHGKGHWNRIAKNTGLNRCGKSCRLRWMNYLDPNVKRGDFSEEEDDLILRLHKLLGNRWSLIAGRIPGRTDNQVKNYWNAHLSKQIGCATKRQRMEPTPNSKEEIKIIAKTESAELKNACYPLEHNNIIGDASSLTQTVDAFFADGENSVTGLMNELELEQQMSMYQRLMQDSDEFLLQYDFGWNVEQQELTFL